MHHYHGHVGVESNHIAADNENHKVAVSDAINMERIEGEPKNQVVFLKLPSYETSQLQYMTDCKDWQGRDWSEKPDGKLARVLKSTFSVIDVIDQIDGAELETYGYWLKWEFPIYAIGRRGKATGYTPTKLTEDSLAFELKAMRFKRRTLKHFLYLCLELMIFVII